MSTCGEDIVNFLKKRIRNEPFVENFEQSKKWLYDLMKNTIETGESSTALIVDLTTSLRTRIIDDAVLDIKSIYENSCSIIQLHGRLHGEADNAFHEIVENLSVDCTPDMEIMGSIAEKVDFVLKCIRNEKENKPVIIILEDFHLFCDEVENTLIYPMIDVLHSNVPICVIGVTVDQTCIQRLGKRVTSRFSSKIVYLKSKNIFERNLSAFQTLLSLDNSRFSEDLVAEWNTNVSNLAKNPVINNLIKYLSEMRFSEEKFRRILFSIACQIDENKKHFTVEEVVDCIESFVPQICPRVMDSLTDIELCLVIAIQHHLAILKEPVFNFKVIFHRYSKVRSRCGSFTQISEQQGKKAFESLILLGLIKPFQSATSELMDYMPCYFRPESSVVRDYIGKSNYIPDVLKQWLKNPLFCE